MSFGNLHVGGSFKWADATFTVYEPDCDRAPNHLNLSHNELVELPASFGEVTLGAATGLDLRSNKLQSLPASIGALRVDGYLNLDSNVLQRIPAEFANITVTGTVFMRAQYPWEARMQGMPPRPQPATEDPESMDIVNAANIGAFHERGWGY